MTELLSSRKLSQTKISSYFSGCVRSVPSEQKLVLKGRSRSTRRRLFSSCAGSQLTMSQNTDSPVRSQLLLNIPKRKLPAPIFSDDEDSDFETSSQSSTLTNQKSGKRKSEQKSRAFLNKPSPAKCRKKFSDFDPPSTSTPIPVSQQTRLTFPKSTTSKLTCIQESEIPSCSKQDSINNNNICENALKYSTGIKVLQTVVISSPSKSLQKNVIDCESCTQDGKKVLQSGVPSPSKSPQKNSNVIDRRSYTQERKKVLQSGVSPPLKSPPKNHQSVEDGKKLNFEHLKVLREFCANVMKSSHLRGLLNDTDKNLLNKFFNVEKNYQYFAVKLFLWKPIWYNVFHFVERIGLQMEDSEVTKMYKFMDEEKYVDTDYMTEDTFTLLHLLTLGDLRAIARSFKFSSTAGAKDTIISRLLKHVKTQITLTSKNAEQVLRDRIKEKMGVCVKLSTDLRKCLYHIFLLNTFTNSTLIEPQEYFTNVTYFNVVFPSYEVENFNVFYTPDEFSLYAEAVKLRSELQKSIENKDVPNIFEICKCAISRLKELNNRFGDSYESSREAHLERFTPNAQYIGILSSGAKHITTLHYNDVKTWFEYLIDQKYCSHKRVNWYSQLILIHTVYLKQYQKAAELVIKAFEQDSENITEVQLHELAHRAKMLNKKTYNLSTLLQNQIAMLVPPSCDRSWPQDVLDCKSMKSNEPGRRRTYVHRNENGDVNYLNVEQAALKYYQSLGYPNGEHCEGDLIVASFCLLFWDIIYDKFVKGTLISNVQNAPLDMYTQYFYINREQFIMRRLKNIEKKWTNEQFKKRIFVNYKNHSHETSLCSIESVVKDPQHLYDILICIGRPVLSKIFHRLAKNFKVYRSGFPDLIIWNPQEEKAKFVEVKSENDTLSIKQKLWLNYLLDIGASVAVCRVEPKASKKKF